MQIAAIILVLFGGLLLLAPDLRDVIPRVHLEAQTWQWIAFGSIALAALLYFLAPRD